MKNIILCGFMGCGKTTVGKELSALLHVPFADTDKAIEKNAGMSVRSIFERFGEARFREMETEAIRELSKKRGIVIAAGGGAVLNEQNVAAFRSGGTIVFLDVPPELIELRLRKDSSRPLLNVPGKAAALRSLYLARLPAYRAAADLIVAGNNSAPHNLAETIIHLLKSD